jgi:hypothetical protein
MVALLAALTVSFVLSVPVPDTLEGEKLQDQPSGNPEHAKESFAQAPFCEITLTFIEAPCAAVALTELAESAST